MVNSLNTTVDYTIKGTWFREGPIYGNILIGDQSFEFYNDTKLHDYIQIPWNEIDKVRAQLFFKDRYIRGFFIDTKSAGSFNFVVKNAGKCLKEMRTFVGEENIVRSKPLFTMRNLFKK